MNRNSVILGVGAVLIAMGVASFGSPYWTVRQIRAAAEAGDSEAVSEFVDFPALRESIKTEIQARILTSTADSPLMKGNPFAGLATAFAMAMTGPMVDAMVSPAGIAAMMRGKPSPKLAAKPSPPSQEGDKNEITVRSGYTGLNRFEMTFAPADAPGKQGALVFRRDGLFSWKLSRLRFPP